MATVNSFRELEIWQLANLLEQQIFQQLKLGTLKKDFELVDQMKRSSGSVIDNIAEGFGRGSRLEFIHFLSISTGSLAELQSQLERAKNREHFSKEIFIRLNEMSTKVEKKIGAMIRYLNGSTVKGQKFNNRSKAEKSEKNN